MAEASQTILVIDGSRSRGTEFARAVAGPLRLVHVESDLGRALETLARLLPDALLVDGRVLERAGDALAKRLAAFAPWASVVALGDELDAARRRDLVRRYSLHAVVSSRVAAEGDVDLVASALAAAQRARRLLAEAELRELIVAKLCHELRTCLYVVEGYAEILGDARPGVARAEVAERIAATSRFALDTVRSYLAHANLEPRDATAGDAVDLQELTDDLQRDVARRTRVRPLRLRVATTVRGAVLDVDGEKLRCVLAQLMAHAAERSGAGTVRLDIRSGASATEFLLIGERVRDAAAPSAQGMRSTDEQLAGLNGLGLAIALRLTRLLGGTLDVDSVAQVPRFRLRLPVAPRSRRGLPDVAQAEGSGRPILH